MKKTLLFLISIIFSTIVNGQNLYFPPLSGDSWETMSPYSLNWCDKRIDSLYNFLETNNTKAFILLKDGKIVLEKYFGATTLNSPLYWASAGKTITSFLIGKAQEEGFLDITDKTSRYLGQGWTNCTPEQENKITVRHQLTMTTGLDDGVPDNHCYETECLIYKSDAGTRWAYHNAPYTLLDNVLENAIQTTMNQYLYRILTQNCGITGTFVHLDYDNIFFSKARSMARFGLLILNNGNWNGNQIMTDAAYFEQMINTSQDLNKSYGYLWWLNGKTSFMVPTVQYVFSGKLNPDAPDDMIAALGKNGQFLNVVKGQNLIWIRMGDAPDNTDIPYFLNNDIWKYINQLSSCNDVKINEIECKYAAIIENNVLKINSESQIARIEIINLNGQIIESKIINCNSAEIPLNGIHNQVFILRIVFSNGKIKHELKKN